MREQLKIPAWAVKKALRSITLYHFYKITTGKHGPNVYADWVIVVSFKKGLDVKVYNVEEWEKMWHEFRTHEAWPEGYYVQGEWSPNSLKSKKWVAYMGPEFTPSKTQSTEDLIKSNPAIKWHIIDTIFIPGPTIKRR